MKLHVALLASRMCLAHALGFEVLAAHHMPYQCAHTLLPISMPHRLSGFTRGTNKRHPHQAIDDEKPTGAKLVAFGLRRIFY